MADHKQDLMAATGAHRAWIGERNGDAALSRAAMMNRDARNLGLRAQPPAGKSNARHAAITRGLSNFPNYKTWAEKAKTNWQKDKPENDRG